MTERTAFSGLSPERLARISVQMERLESRESEWAVEPAAYVTRSTSVADPFGGRESVFPKEGNRGSLFGFLFGCAWERFVVILKVWEDQIERLVWEMRQQAKQPFSIRTQQISVLCAFFPFAIAVLTAGVRFMPRMPSLPLWSKITWFVALPVFLAMAGALVGFVIGVLLDSLERQVREQADSKAGESSEPVAMPVPPAAGVRSGVWVAVEDLEPNQRVAETVTGADGSPILLRHTLLQPTHIEMLKNQGVGKIRVEVMKYPAENDVAVAG